MQCTEKTPQCYQRIITGECTCKRILPQLSQEDTFAMVETHFWAIVDRDGLTGLPSDMWEALDILVTRAKRAAA